MENSSDHSSSSSVGLIIGLIIGGIILLLLIIGVAVILFKRRLWRTSSETTHENIELNTPESSPDSKKTVYAPLTQAVTSESEKSTEIEIHKSLTNSVLLNEKEGWIIDVEDIHLEKEIGRGGMLDRTSYFWLTLFDLAFGIVFQGTWRETPGSENLIFLKYFAVAVKQMSVEQMSPSDIENFLHEIQLMRGLRNHSNVVMVFYNATFFSAFV